MATGVTVFFQPFIGQLPHFSVNNKSQLENLLTGSAVAMIGANLRFGSSSANVTSNVTKVFQCHPGGTAEAALIFALGTLGMAANLALMGVILSNRQLRR